MTYRSDKLGGGEQLQDCSVNTRTDGKISKGWLLTGLIVYCALVRMAKHPLPILVEV